MALVYNQTNLQNDPTHIYYDLDMTNNDQTGLKAPVPLVFNEIRNSPVLSNPSDYFLSVIRFQVDSVTLPSFIPQIEVGQANPNKTIYTVTLSYQYLGNIYTVQEPVIFVPQQDSEPVPAPPLTQQDLTSEYYYIYSYQWFIRLINTALTDAYVALDALVTGAGGALPSSHAPFLVWDSNTSKAKLYADQAGYDDSLSPPIFIFFNSPLFTLFSSFQATYLGYQNISNGQNYLMNVYSNYTNLQTLTTPAATFIVMEQEYPTAPVWNAVESIVFTTGLIPVVPTNVAVPSVFNSEANLINTGNNANISNVISDFEVGLTSGWEYKPLVQYNPTSEYRMYDLQSNQPLSAIELRCFWKDRFGNLYPLKLASGCSANMKIMFRKKAFNLSEPKYDF